MNMRIEIFRTIILTVFVYGCEILYLTSGKTQTGGSFLSLHRALLNLYIVHSPTNALFIKLVKV